MGGRRLGDLRARPRRRRVRARGRAGRDVVIAVRGHASLSAVLPGRAPSAASSSTSTSRGRTAACIGGNVYQVRKELGRRLAREHPVDADIVIPVPDSGRAGGDRLRRESGIPFEMGLIRNHYVRRTFIEPQQSIRHFGVKVKLNAQRERARGQARGRGRRFDRARHDAPQDRQDDAKRRRARSAPADQLAADDRARATTASTRRRARS